MPELPEVETVCRQLDPELSGRRILRLRVLDDRWCRPVPAREVEKAMAERTIRGLGRRGKYLLLRLDAEQTLVMHLRMTGNLVLIQGDAALDPSEGRRLYEGERSTSERHLRARFTLDDGRELWFTDPRRFGEAFLLDDTDYEGRFESLGVEPLSEEFTVETLGEISAERTVPLKSFLLDQSGVAGSATSMRTRRSSVRDCIHSLPPAPCGRSIMRPCAKESLRRWRPASKAAGRRSTTTGTGVARRGRCRMSSWSTHARANPARAARGPSSESSSAAVRLITAPAARCGFVAGPAEGRSGARNSALRRPARHST